MGTARHHYGEDRRADTAHHCLRNGATMKWEYKTLKLNVEGWFGPKFKEEEVDAQLNGMGYDGWELVSAFDTNAGYGATRDLVLLFKRPLDR